MELLYFVLGVIILYQLWQLAEWILFKIKYPVLSDTPPMGILHRCDMVIIEGKEYEYTGIDNNGDIYYVFQDGLSFMRLTLFQAIKQINAVKGRFGYKWRKTSNKKRLNFLEEKDTKDEKQFFK